MTHRAFARAPRGEGAPQLSDDPLDLEAVRRDASNAQGNARALARPASEAQIAALLRAGLAVLPVGMQSSLTGGATPRGEVVLSLARFTRLERTGETVHVGAGVALTSLREFLQAQGRDYPAGPTYEGASVGGLVANNAAGAATFKYGTTRAWVQGLTVVLAAGDVLELRRGEVTASEDGRFVIEGPGGRREVRVPGYRTPELPKCAGGYYARPGLDLVDLFVGSEGTLGILTEVELRTLPAREVLTLWLPLAGEAQALALAAALRGVAHATWSTRDPQGLDVRSIESLDARCLSLLREDGHTRFVPKGAGYGLIVGVELPHAPLQEYRAALERAFEDGAPDHPLTRLVRLLQAHGAFDDAQLALPGEPFAAELLRLREAVPEGVNRRAREVGAVKVGGDALVPFERLGEWLGGVRAGFAEAGLDLAVWGHLSDGNLHPNLVAHSPEDVKPAYELMLAAAREAVRLGGAPLSEHGVGKHSVKQRLLAEFYGDAAIAEMRAVKRALDPQGQLAPGNVFSAEVTA